MVETRRQQIDDVASALFRERGYAATSVRDIARALDLQGASLYAHVASKEDLLWSIVCRAAERFEAAADAAASQAAERTPIGRLRALVRAHVGVVTSAPEEAVVFVQEWRSLGPARRAEALRRRDAYEGRFRSAIARGQRSRAFAPGDPTVAAAFLLTALNGIATWYRPDGQVKPDALADACADLALRALGTGSRAGAGARPPIARRSRP